MKWKNRFKGTSFAPNNVSHLRSWDIDRCLICNCTLHNDLSESEEYHLFYLTNSLKTVHMYMYVSHNTDPAKFQMMEQNNIKDIPDELRTSLKSNFTCFICSMAFFKFLWSWCSTGVWWSRASSKHTYLKKTNTYIPVKLINLICSLPPSSWCVIYGHFEGFGKLTSACFNEMKWKEVGWNEMKWGESKWILTLLFFFLELAKYFANCKKKIKIYAIKSYV